MLYTIETDKPLDQLCRDLEQAVAAHQFGILGVIDLKQKMNDKGLEFEPPCRIFEVCNPHQARKVLMQDLAVATALPCRIAVYEKGGRVTLSTIRPTIMLEMFPAVGLTDVARDVEQTMIQIMDAAAG